MSWHGQTEDSTANSLASSILTTTHSDSTAHFADCSGCQLGSCNSIHESSDNLTATHPAGLVRAHRSTQVINSINYQTLCCGDSHVSEYDSAHLSPLSCAAGLHQLHNSSGPVASVSMQTHGLCAESEKNQSMEDLQGLNINIVDGTGSIHNGSFLGSQRILYSAQFQPTLVDLPTDLLFNILQRLPTVSLIACARTHKALDTLINSTHFLNVHTRCVLGFPENQKDITYDIVPASVAPLQHLWFEEYLYHAAPHMVGLIQPRTIFYDLLCFRHLLDTWLLQGLGYKYRMFVSDVLQCSKPPPLLFLKCMRCILIPSHVLRVLVKVALCQPDILVLTINDFEELSISCCGPPSDLDDVWDRAVPSEYKDQKESDALFTCEVVSRHRGLALASFFITCSQQSVMTWSGVIDYSTFRWRDTWGFGRFSPDTPLNDMRELCKDLFHEFRHYVGNEYISLHCPNAFLFRSLCKMIQHRQTMMPQLQDMLEKMAVSIKRKAQNMMSQEDCKYLRLFLDSTQFVDGDELTSPDSLRKVPQHELSKTFDVAIQRYLHRYLNKVIGQQVLQLYQDPMCHHVLCLNCRNANVISSCFLCPSADHVGPQRIPLKVWPPHLLHCGMQILPGLVKLVRLDIELWKRCLLGEPLSEKVAEFVRQVLNTLYLDITLDPCKRGVIAMRLLL